MEEFWKKVNHDTIAHYELHVKAANVLFMNCFEKTIFSKFSLISQMR